MCHALRAAAHLRAPGSCRSLQRAYPTRALPTCCAPHACTAHPHGRTLPSDAPGRRADAGAARSTGWLTRWGEPMANTSLADFTKALDGILAFNNGSGSVNLYMAHGGTNFGYTAGALDVLYQ